MISRIVSARPRYLCLALLFLLIAQAAPLLAAGSAPVAVVGPTDQTVDVGEAAWFTGERSYYAVGNITSYDWDFGDGSSGKGVTVSHAYSTPGRYVVSLVCRPTTAPPARARAP